MTTAMTILAVLIAVAFFMFGVGKILDVSMMATAREHLSIEPSLFKIVGTLEILGAIGVVAGLHDDLPVIGVLAGLGLIGMTIGATFYHQKAGDSIKEWLPAVAMGSVVIIYMILRVGTA